MVEARADPYEWETSSMTVPHQTVFISRGDRTPSEPSSRVHQRILPSRVRSIECAQPRTLPGGVAADLRRSRSPTPDPTGSGRHRGWDRRAGGVLEWVRTGSQLAIALTMLGWSGWLVGNGLLTNGLRLPIRLDLSTTQRIMSELMLVIHPMWNQTISAMQN